MLVESRKGNIQLRKILVYFWACPAVMFSFCAHAADTPAAGESGARARIVVVGNPGAMVAFEPQEAIVQGMVDQGILKLTGKPALKEAWRTFVSPKDVVGIKVYSGPGANSGTRPAVVGAVVKGLLRTGLPPSHIIIWDRRLLDLRLAGFDALAQHYKVRLAGATDSGFDDTVYYDSAIMGSLSAGDLEFDRDGKTTGRRSYLSKLVTKTVTKIINVSPLLNHNLAGVCGNLYSLSMGSIDNTLRFEGSAERLATAVPEIYAKRALSDHVVLNITDALIGQYQGEQMSLLHYSTELNQIWFSKDPVALDVTAIRELDQERQDRDLLQGNDNPDLFKNASFFLELGVSDPAKIQIETIK